ncbi:MAG: hypothetical protein LBL49_02620 [Clostridiales Family XIII bacterium]|jgi:hypothetical protein|nr:hypothetical protein [Clostridiales Family XIII bacterium]
MLYESAGESYDELIPYLGVPNITDDMGDGSTYMAYSLREGQGRNAYFILNDNKVISQGVMYGDDYAALYAYGE